MNDELARVLNRLFPVTIEREETHANLVFAEHPTQAMTMAPWDWELLSNALPELLAERDRLKSRIAVLSPYAALGLSVSEDWPDLSEIDGGDLFDMMETSGVIVKHPEPYDPDRHPFIEEVDEGDEWFTIPNRNEARAALNQETKP